MECFCTPSIMKVDMKPALFDSHAHLDDRRFDEDREDVIKVALDSGVRKLINVGADIKSSRSTVLLAEEHDFIYASVGVHPHSAAEYDQSAESELSKMAKLQKVVAIGEVGLDYHYDISPRDLQKTAFVKQLQLAASEDLPVIIHNREAHQDCFDILKQEKNEKQRGVFHCYSGSAEMVKDVISLGFYVSFAGVITFKNAKKAVQALKKVPLERLLFETDCPYLAPEPNRGRRNQPSYVGFTAMKIAMILEIEYAKLCEIVWNNTHMLFNRLPKNNHMIK